MQVIRAEVLGMCFGVKDALKIINNVSEPRDVTIHGELVHNGQVLRSLSSQGFAMTGEADRRGVPDSPVVLITAHGISDRERSRLLEAGKQLIDTTCPLVKRVHLAARKLHSDGYFVVVVGRRGHVEVQGIIEDLERYDLIESASEVKCYGVGKLAVICQTTTTERLAVEVHEGVRRQNPESEVRFVDTICQPTRDHQRALTELLQKVDAMVVVGGRNSNNTRQLVARSEQFGKPALHIESAREIDPEWFRGFEVIGLTAGTSTLDATIDEVERALHRIPDCVEAV